MTKDDLFIGMVFKTSQDPYLYGVCTNITEKEFIFIWNYPNKDSSTDVKATIKSVLECFNYYGWYVVSSLEKELL